MELKDMMKKEDMERIMSKMEKKDKKKPSKTEMAKKAILQVPYK